MENIKQVKTSEGIFFSLYSEEENVSLVFRTLEQAIRGVEEPYGILTEDNEISKGDEILGKVEETKDIDPVLIEKIKKTMGE